MYRIVCNYIGCLGDESYITAKIDDPYRFSVEQGFYSSPNTIPLSGFWQDIVITGIVFVSATADDKNPAKPYDFPALFFAIDFTGNKGFFVLRVRRVLLPLKLGEFLFSALSNCLNQILVPVINKVQKRRFLPIFLSHKEKRNIR